MIRQTGRDKFRKYKTIIDFLVKLFGFLGKSFNRTLLGVFRNTNGFLGLLLRYIFLKNCAKSIGDNVSIQPNVFLFNLSKISIGSNVSIHPMCYLDGAGGLTIEDNVSIAHNCSILTTNHQWMDITLPIKYNPESYSSVLIKSDVWLGCGVRVMAGVTINSRSIIAAGAVLTKNVEANSLFAGVPAKEIKKI